MSQRGATMAVAGALLVLLTAVAALLPVPYAAVQPGPTFNTLGSEDGTPLIEISGRQTYPAGGHLNLTTVSATGPESKLGLLEALQGWLDPDIAVVPRETLYSDDQTAEEIEQRNAEDMEVSQEHAVAAALLELGIEPDARTALVAHIDSTAPAWGKLHAGDVILTVDGTVVTMPEEVSVEVRKHRPGEEVEFMVRRGGEDVAVRVGTRAAPDDANVAQVGIGVEAGYEWPFDVRIQLDNVGGPSAGLMFALGIYDLLTAGDLTGGDYFAGTGTIADDGTVGPIGGIQQKIAKAHDEGAVAFLAPSDNCAEAARSAPEDLLVLRVTNLDDALAALDAVTSGDATSVPAC